MRVAYGAEKYFSLITTTADSDIEELADLEGEVFASAAPTSVSGTLFPLYMLSNAGIDIGSAPSGSPEDFELRTSDHSTAREQLIQDDRIAAARDRRFLHGVTRPAGAVRRDVTGVRRHPEYDGAGEDDPELQLLAVSDPIPRAPIVSNAAWEESLKDDIRQLMIDAPQEAFEHDSQADIAEALNIDPEILDMDESELSEDQREDLDLVEAHALWFSGVVEASAEDYDPVAQLGQELGLEWNEL